MSLDRIVLATCARNIAQHVHILPSLLKGVAELARDATLVVVESDSSDCTLDRLRRLAWQHTNFELHSLGDLRFKINSRTQRIAACRNLYLRRAQSLLKGSPDSLLVVFDSDGVLGRRFVVNAGRQLRATIHRLANTKWISCSGITIPYYYDVFALRADNWAPDDCWTAARALHLESGFEEEVAYRLAIRSRQICLSEARSLIPVNSAFNGLCIYKGNAIENVEYSGVAPDGLDVCEHVSLHLQQSHLHPGAAHYIDPQLVLGFTPLSYRSSSGSLEATWHVANTISQVREMVMFRLRSLPARLSSSTRRLLG